MDASILISIVISLVPTLIMLVVWLYYAVLIKRQIKVTHDINETLQRIAATLEKREPK